MEGVRTVGFIGIGGIGISALARLCLSKGMRVWGINDEESHQTLDPLRALGADISLERKIQDADLYVYSDAWLYRGPELIQEAKTRGKTLSYFEALGEFSKGYDVIAISGTHGKTTVTAMVGEILAYAGLDPTVVVGSFVRSFGGNFRNGKGEYFVVEADEYMRHFLNFSPYVSAVINLEPDHLDYYKDIEDIQGAFKEFISRTKEFVVCSNDVVPLAQGKKVLYPEEYLQEVPKLKVPGVHNRHNASVAYALSRGLGIDDAVIKEALSLFEGTARRLEKKGVTQEGAIVYDDYAHHPTEIRASIQALKEEYPDKKLTVVFQPHLYSRTKALFEDFATAFTGADDVYILPIYFAREDMDESVSSERLAGKMGARAPSFEEAKELLKGKLDGDDILVTMGAGEAYTVGDALL